MKLGLLTTLNSNIGDDFIREGLLHCIRQVAPDAKLELVMLDKHEPQMVYPRRHPIRLFDKKNSNRAGWPNRSVCWLKNICRRSATQFLKSATF